MQYTTLITHISDNSWRAVVPALPDCAVEADSRNEAVTKIKEKIQDVVRRIEVVQISVPEEPTLTAENGGYQENGSPWDMVKMFVDDPTWDQLFDKIEEERDDNTLEPLPEVD